MRKVRYINLNLFLTLILLINVFYGFLLFLMYDSLFSTYYFYSVLLSYLLSLFYYKYNLLFFIRTVFLGLMGIIPFLAVNIFNSYFAFRATFTQTKSITFIMLILSSFALFSSHIGFEFSKKIKIIKNKINNITFKTSIFLFLFLLITAYFIGVMRGDFIFNSVYASTGTDLPIHNLNTIGGILVYILFFKYATSIKYRKIYLYLLVSGSMYLIIWNEFLRGARMDPLTVIISLSILYKVYFHNNDVSIKLKDIILLGILFVIITVWGFLRVAYSQGFDIGSIIKVFSGLKATTAKNGVNVVFVQGTLNNLYITISDIIYAIKHHFIDFWYGESYFDYILRTPPKFLYPSRPESLAWLPGKLLGEGVAAGGFTELAEIYLNFGIFGALFIPGIISFFIGYFFKLFINNKNSLIHAIPLFAILSVYLRGNLYQTFTFYKSIVAAFIIFIIIIFIDILFKKRGLFENS